MADFELRHLKMAYMTMLARSSNSASKWWRILNLERIQNDFKDPEDGF